MGAPQAPRSAWWRRVQVGVELQCRRRGLLLLLLLLMVWRSRGQQEQRRSPPPCWWCWWWRRGALRDWRERISCRPAPQAQNEGVGGVMWAQEALMWAQEASRTMQPSLLTLPGKGEPVTAGAPRAPWT